MNDLYIKIWQDKQLIFLESLDPQTTFDLRSLIRKNTLFRVRLMRVHNEITDEFERHEIT